MKYLIHYLFIVVYSFLIGIEIILLITGSFPPLSAEDSFIIITIIGMISVELLVIISLATPLLRIYGYYLSLFVFPICTIYLVYFIIINDLFNINPKILNITIPIIYLLINVYILFLSRKAILYEKEINREAYDTVQEVWKDLVNFILRK